MPPRSPRRPPAKRRLTSSAALIPDRPTLSSVRGATAAQTLLGGTFRVTQHRGALVKSPLAPLVLATVHPSSLLRAPDPETRRRENGAVCRGSPPHGAGHVEEPRSIREGD